MVKCFCFSAFCFLLKSVIFSSHIVKSSFEEFLDALQFSSETRNFLFQANPKGVDGGTPRSLPVTSGHHWSFCSCFVVGMCTRAKTNCSFKN